MKPYFFAPVLGLLLVACTKPETQIAEPEEKTLSLFHEGKGVILPEEMQKRFGLELADVTETNLPVEIEKQAQVYRASVDDSPAFASVLLTAAETQIVKPNQAVQIKGDGFRVSGTVLQLDQATEKASGQTEVLLQFPDTQEQVASGDSVDATFVITKKESAVVVPRSALLTAAIGTFVYAVNGKHFLRTKVVTGAASESTVEIIDGLYAGDVVVAKGVSDLWLIELQATKTGQACCVVPKK